MKDIMNLEMWRKFQPKSDEVDIFNDEERFQILVVQLFARSSSVNMVTSEPNLITNYKGWCG